jgi:hypothetical protein
VAFTSCKAGATSKSGGVRRTRLELRGQVPIVGGITEDVLVEFKQASKGICCVIRW